MSERVKFGIIGCGRIAQRHAEHISKKGELVAVCDNVKEKADQFAAQYQTKAYYSVEEFLSPLQELHVGLLMFLIRFKFTVTAGTCRHDGCKFFRTQS